MKVKEELVSDVLDKLRHIARIEANLLFREYRNNPSIQLTKYSEAISDAINRATDAVVEALNKDYELIDSVTKRRLMEEALPKKLIEIAGDKLDDLPKSYIISMMGSSLGSKMVYNEGLDYINALPTESLLEFATSYLYREDQIKALISVVENVDGCQESDKADIIKVLQAAGVRSALAAGL